MIIDDFRTTNVTIVHATFVLVTIVHIGNISVVTDTIWTKF